MPKKSVIERAKKLKEEGKSPSTQAGEFIKNEIEEIRHGEHGARSTKQAIAIGLSEARRAGVNLPPPKKGKYSDEVREKAKHDREKGQKNPNAKPSPTRSKATTKALQKEDADAASHAALSRHSIAAARQRTAEERSASAKKAAASRTAEQRSESAKKAARTRKERK